MAVEQPHRILMTADAVGGVWQYSLSLLSAYSRLGWDCMLVVLGPAPDHTQQLAAQEIRGLTLCCRDYALEWMPDPWADVDASGRWLLELASDFSPGIVHLNGYSHAVLPFNCPVIAVAHSCVLSWWRSVHGTAAPAEWDTYRSRVSAGLSRAAAVVAPSQAMAHSLQCNYGNVCSPVVIPNFSSYTPLAERHRKEPFCLAGGRLWDVGKNLRVLLDVADQIAWPIFAAGDYDLRSQSLFTSHLQLLGRVSHPEMLEIADRASIFLNPALYEPFGLAVLEAAQRGCCLVLADIASLREMWGEAAVFVPPNNPLQWADMTSCLIANAARRTEMGQRARIHARRYSEQCSIPAYLNLYQALSDRYSRAQSLAS